MSERNLWDKMSPYLFILVLVLAGSSLAWTANIQNRDAPEAEPVDLSDYAKISWVKELSDWHKQNYETVADAQANRTAIHEEHAVLTSTVNDLKTEVAILKASSDITTQPQETKTDSSSFDLILADANGNFGSNFLRGEVILLTGKTEFEKANSRIVITDPNGQTAKDKTFNTYSDGTFTESFITDSNTPKGEYLITVTIRGNHEVKGNI